MMVKVVCGFLMAGIYSAGFQRGVGSLHLSAARGWCRLKYHSTRSPGDHGFMEREMYPPRSVGLWRQYHHIRMVRRKCVNVQAAGLRYDGERRINRSREGRMKKGGTDAKVAREIGEILSRRDMRLALHFDLNKTLLMVDPAGGKTESQVLNDVLSEICWGNVEMTRAGLDGVERSWRWDGGPPSPKLDGEHSKCLLTYSDFLHQEFGDAKGRDNDSMKATRDQLKGSFTEKHQPGRGLRGELIALEKALRLPQGATRSPLAERAGLADRKSWYIIPAFFECVLALKKAEVEFSLVFRTFGRDLEKVAVEFNAFCEGRHPCFLGVKMDGSDGMPDYRLHFRGGRKFSNCNVGSFFRDEEGIALVMGTLQNPHSREEVSTLENKGHLVYRSVGAVQEAVCSIVCPTQQPVPTSVAGRMDWCNGAAEGALGGLEAQANCCSLALRDYYPFWRHKLEAPDAGKILPVDISPDSKVWPVMFDDNIGRSDSKEGAHIVDVRDAATGLPIPFETAVKLYLVRAEPYLAVLKWGLGPDLSNSESIGHDNYFLSEVLTTLTREEHRSSSAGPEP